MIKLAKLVSQEFVIGRHIDNLLTNVARVNFNIDPATGQNGINIVPYMHPITTSLAKIIPADKIIYMEDAPKQLQTSYLEMIKTILEAQQVNQEATNDGQNGVHGNNKGETGEAKGEATVPE